MLRSGLFLSKRASICLAIAVLILLWAGQLSAASARETGNAAAPAPDFESSVQPVFNRRYSACHGCLGSPCNVKLDSFRSADRGGFEENPFAANLGFSPRTDMDAAGSTAAWRERGFYPVLSRNGASPDKNLESLLLFQMIDAGHRRPAREHPGGRHHRHRSSL